jgi:hypothetical protein
MESGNIEVIFPTSSSALEIFLRAATVGLYIHLSILTGQAVSNDVCIEAVAEEMQTDK